MSRTIAIGEQDFVSLRHYNLFYIDKTKFIKDWWLGRDRVSLITRPRRFGKTLMLDTVKTFFSKEFEGQSDLFEGLDIWKDEKFRNIQGTVPVIFLSFADARANNYNDAVASIKDLVSSTYRYFSRILDTGKFTDWEKELFASMKKEMNNLTFQRSLKNLSECLYYHYQNKPIILLDEYDTPLQDAWINNYWDKFIEFIQGFSNSTFKTNPYLERALITGITRVAKESIFSDMNNLEVVSTTSSLYSDCFGFTEEEVFLAMDEYCLTEKEKVRQWYDGFIFGKTKKIYNPWSIINYLKKKEFCAYWANTSSNKIIGDLILNANEDVKEETMELLKGKSIETVMDEDIVFSQLDDPGAIWSFLMAAGYLKPIDCNPGKKEYTLTLTNHEVHLVLNSLISNWFKKSITYNRKFIKALLSDDLKEMNAELTNITRTVFSFFDCGRNEPERFYHGFVLGLIVDLEDRYMIKSNRESGDGRYDITMFPKQPGDHGIVIEFKTLDSQNESNLENTCRSALKQIRQKNYIAELVNHDVMERKIYVYGFAFHGKKVLVCGGSYDQIDWTDIMEEKDLLCENSPLSR